MFSKDIYVQRRKELCSKMSGGIALFLGNQEASCNYPDNTYRFRQDSNFLYYFGLDEADLNAAIDLESGTATLFGDEIGIDSIVWMGPQPSRREQADMAGIEDVLPTSAISQYVQKAREGGRTVHSLPPYRGDNKLRLESYVGISPAAQAENASVELIRAIVAMRQIKKEEEIKELDIAANAGYAMHYTVMKMAKLGMLEQELTGIMEGVGISYGYMPSFPIILSQNGETMHNHTHHQILTDGRLLLVDAGAEIGSHYASDFTRTFPCSGKFNPQQKDIYNLVLKCQEAGMEMCRPGMPFKDVHLGVARIMIEGLKDLGFMKGNVDDAVTEGAHAMFWPCGLGHNMGLDVHDMEDLGEFYVGYDNGIERSTQFGLKSLRMTKNLEPGMVMTVEPGIYFIPALIDLWEAQGINKKFINFKKVRELIGFGGIRIEDDVLITADGYRLLGSKRLPASIAEIEETMQG